MARHGRLVLVCGLIVGAAWPDLAQLIRPYVAPIIAGLLFLSSLRIGPAGMAIGRRGALVDIVQIGIFQLAMPLAALFLFWIAGMRSSAATFVVLVLAASPITGSPNLAIMMGIDPARSLRLVILGSALLPSTSLPVFWLAPEFGDSTAVLLAVLKLLGIIAAASAAAFILRATLMKEATPNTLARIDGVSAIGLAVVVIGLMSAVGPALRADLGGFAVTLALVCLCGFALQLLVVVIFRAAGHHDVAASGGIVSSNRNVALFLTVLPTELIDSVLLLIGCYQIQMYLTPLALGWAYRLLSIKRRQYT